MVQGVSWRRNSQQSSALDAVANTKISPSSAGEQKAIVVIDKRVLFRDCLARCLQISVSNHVVLAFASVAEWHEVATQHPRATVVIFCDQGFNHAQTETARELALLARAGTDVPVVLVSDADDVDHVLGALQSGARGYIPTSATLDIAVGAMHVVAAGGTFVPANSLFASRRTAESAASENGQTCRLFTVRQAAVVDALRHGKPNKQIAYELNMRESTVKLHVRNIMRKLKAKNRTEAALLTSSLSGELHDR
jgi:DNA-binding NarL/FixJ family response regulator